MREDIAEEKYFRSAWNAFISSFLKSVAVHGLEYTMDHELHYADSNHKQNKAEKFNNTMKRLNNYKVESSFYDETEKILKEYPVDFTNAHVYIRLRDCVDVNNALNLGWLYRTDEWLEYQYTPLEQTQNLEKGIYTLTKRPRQGQELFQLVQQFHEIENE